MLSSVCVSQAAYRKPEPKVWLRARPRQRRKTVILPEKFLPSRASSRALDLTWSNCGVGKESLSVELKPGGPSAQLGSLRN